MSALAPAAQIPVATLGVLALVLFWVGGRRGLWPVWLAGYACLAAAVAAALFWPW